MENSKISWTDNTFNPWLGCRKISSGCENCYAEAQVHRWGKDELWNSDTRSPTGEAYWKKPLEWNKKAQAQRIPLRVFCGSMCDVFEDIESDIVKTQRERLFDLIENTQWLNWMLLTKRIDIAARIMKERFPERIPYNIWMGVTIEGDDPGIANQRADILRSIPAFIRFISFEPLLGEHIPDLAQIQLAIIGGESGKGSKIRRMSPEWAYNLLDACKKQNVSYFFKQTGNILADEWNMSGKGDNLDQLPPEHAGLRVERMPFGYQRHIR